MARTKVKGMKQPTTSGHVAGLWRSRALNAARIVEPSDSQAPDEHNRQILDNALLASVEVEAAEATRKREERRVEAEKRAAATAAARKKQEADAAQVEAQQQLAATSPEQAAAAEEEDEEVAARRALRDAEARVESAHEVDEFCDYGDHPDGALDLSPSGGGAPKAGRNSATGQAVSSAARAAAEAADPEELGGGAVQRAEEASLQPEEDAADAEEDEQPAAATMDTVVTAARQRDELPEDTEPLWATPDLLEVHGSALRFFAFEGYDLHTGFEISEKLTGDDPHRVSDYDAKRCFESYLLECCKRNPMQWLPIEQGVFETLKAVARGLPGAHT